MFKRNKLPYVFTAKDVAAYLRFSEATILRMAREGIIPGAKVGRMWRFSRETILSLLKDSEFIRKPRSEYEFSKSR